MTTPDVPIKDLQAQITRRKFICHLGVASTAAAGVLLAPGVFVAEAAGEKLIVSASRSNYSIKDPIVFSGRLLDSRGQGIPNAQIAVEDPVLQQSKPAGRTDSGGRFTYQVDGPYNSKAGQFDFRFFRFGSTTPTTTVRVGVLGVAPIFRQHLWVANRSNRDQYNVDLKVDGRSLGQRVIRPGQGQLVLWDVPDGYRHQVAMSCTNLSTSQRYELTGTSQGVATPYSSVCNSVNPTYQNYQARFSNAVNVKTQSRKELKSWSASQSGLFQTKIENEIIGKSARVGVISEGSEGPQYGAGLSGSLGCNYFLGFKAECGFFCGRSVGLEVHLCAGACSPIQPFYQAQCGWSCGVSIAEISCGAAASVGGEMNVL